MQRTILVVEDDEQSLGLISTALTKNGYRVFQAKDSMEAMDLWTDSGPVIDLLISDVRLGGEENGFVLAEKLLAIRPNVPVVFISGDKDCFASPSIQLFGDSPFIAKPFNLKAMLATVADVLAKSGG